MVLRAVYCARGFQHVVDPLGGRRATTFLALWFDGLLAHDGLLDFLGAEYYMDMGSSAPICPLKQAFTLCPHDICWRMSLGSSWLDRCVDNAVEASV